MKRKKEKKMDNQTSGRVLLESPIENRIKFIYLNEKKAHEIFVKEIKGEYSSTKEVNKILRNRKK